MARSAAAVKYVVDELTARRAVVGVDDLILEAGGSREEAEAVRAALRRYLLGDLEGARRILGGVFKNGMVERLLKEFARDTSS